MLVDFSIMPVTGDTHKSEEIAEAIKIVEESGLPHQVTASSTIIEGSFDEVMKVIKQCHERVCQSSPHVITVIKIEDEQGVEDKLVQNLASVEEKIGHAVTHLR